MPASRDDFIWWNGALAPWDCARVHATSETALRGLNVFEGIRAYWRANENAYGVVATTAHLKRLSRSAALLKIPAPRVRPAFRGGIKELLRRVNPPTDIYLRPTVYVEEGAYNKNASTVRTGSFMSWRRAPSSADRTLRCALSTWTRTPGGCIPSAAKTGALYSAFRLARLEALRDGYDEAMLLTTEGSVAETPGGSIFVVQGSTIITPPLGEGILPSITRRIVRETLCPHLGFAVDERRLWPDDLFGANEVFIAGTLDEISRVAVIGTRRFRVRATTSVVRQIQKLYRSLCLGDQLQASGWIDVARCT